VITATELLVGALSTLDAEWSATEEFLVPG
jgi:hypothetical protein